MSLVFVHPTLRSLSAPFSSFSTPGASRLRRRSSRLARHLNRPLRHSPAVTPAQLAIVVGADRKWIQNARRILDRPIRNDEHEARWLGLVHELHTTLGCSLDDAADIADVACDAPADQAIITARESRSRCTVVTLDLKRARQQHRLRLASALELPPADRRGRPPSRWRTIRAELAHRAARLDAVQQLKLRAMHGTALERLTELGALGDLLADLVKAEARFIVVGETAAALQGALIVPTALELLHDVRNESSLRAFAELLDAWGAGPRGIEDGERLDFDAHLLRAVPTLALTVRNQAVTLRDRLEAVGTFTDAEAAIDDRPTFATLPFAILGLPALIRHRKAADGSRHAEERFQLEILEQVRTQRLRLAAFIASGRQGGMRLPETPSGRQNP